jgi:hypothetical protein
LRVRERTVLKGDEARMRGVFIGDVPCVKAYNSVWDFDLNSMYSVTS